MSMRSTLCAILLASASSKPSIQRAIDVVRVKLPALKWSVEHALVADFTSDGVS